MTRVFDAFDADTLLLSPISKADDQIEIGFLSRPGGQRWFYHLPISWKANPFQDNNWRFNLSAWRMMDAPIFEDMLGAQRPDFLRHCLDIALDWYRFHILHDNDHDMRWYDMATGLRALRLSYLIEADRSGRLTVTPLERATLKALARHHLMHLTEESEVALNNHGVFQMVGLFVLSDIFCEPEEKVRNHTFCHDKMAQIFEHNFTPEGIQKEASPDYQKYVAELFSRVLRNFSFAEEFRPLISKALQTVPYMVQPDGRFPPIGDTQGDKIQRRLQRVAKGDVITHEGQKYLLKDWSRSGYVVLGSLPQENPARGFMLFFTGMAYSDSHKHADDLSFTLFSAGQPILTESGKYGYIYDKWRDYVTSARAHNTICLEQTPVRPADVSGWQGSWLSRVSHHKGFLLLRGSLERPGLFFHERRIRVYSPSHIRIEDRILNHTHERAISSLHLAEGLVPEPCDTGYSVALKGDSVLQIAHEGFEETNVKCAGRSPITGWYSPEYKKMAPINTLRGYTAPAGSEQTSVWTLTLKRPSGP